MGHRKNEKDSRDRNSSAVNGTYCYFIESISDKPLFFKKAWKVKYELNIKWFQK